MQHPHRKMSRRELKQDKFILATLKAKDYVEKNGKVIFRGVLLLVAVVIVIVFFIRSKQQASLEAAAMLGQIQMTMYSGNQQAAMDSLQLLVDRYDGTAAAGKATFLLGKFYWERSDYLNAKVYFKKYIDDYLDKTVVSQAALAGYADCLLHEKNHEEAAKYYERAARVNPDFPETPHLLFSAAAAYKEAGKLKKAEELAKKVIDDHQNIQMKNRAEILLEDLKLAQS